MTNYPREFIVNILRTLFHDTRTPLQAMQALAEMIQEDIEGGHLLNAQVNLSHLQTQIRLQAAMFDRTSLAATNMQVYHEQYELCAIGQIMDKVTATARPLAQQKKMVFTSEISSDFPSVIYLDPVNLYRILVNVTNNAIVHCPWETKISLYCEKISDSDFRIRIFDTGPGISLNEIDSIFNSGMRLNQGHPGEGLGLAITQDLIHLLKGDIKVDSKPGQGTSVTLRLPLKPFVV